MRTSRRNKQYQSGLTLVELLITLTILSLVMGVSSAWLQRSLPALSVRANLSTLESDLKQARLRSQTQGVNVVIEMSKHGYEIAALDLSRSFPPSLEIIRDEAVPLIYAEDGTGPAGSITLKKGRAYGTISFDPLTGKITKNL